ncbi:MAG: hypothetical protein U9P38_01490 [Campylobacterota bacterium]|nr:hypothetical protein [Campylobacterota bacterium]
MRTFYYAHTGHRIGLDRFRRGAAIIKSLGEIEITMLCSDFRIAQVAREYGVENSVGVDVVRNIPQIAHHGDRIIFDSDEANPIMLEDMKSFFSTFIHIKSDTVAIDENYFVDEEKTIKMTYFFGDDDYEKDLDKNLSLLDGLKPDLQLGFYYFLDYEDMLKEKFENYHEFEEYQEMIKKTDILITTSPQAVLESLAANGRPIYIKREDYIDDYDNLFVSLNIPIVENYNNKKLTSIVETIDSQNYQKVEHLSNKTNEIIKEEINL